MALRLNRVDKNGQNPKRLLNETAAFRNVRAHEVLPFYIGSLCDDWLR